MLCVSSCLWITSLVSVCVRQCMWAWLELLRCSPPVDHKLAQCTAALALWQFCCEPRGMCQDWAASMVIQNPCSPLPVQGGQAVQHAHTYILFTCNTMVQATSSDNQVLASYLIVNAIFPAGICNIHCSYQQSTHRSQPDLGWHGLKPGAHSGSGFQQRGCNCFTDKPS